MEISNNNYDNQEDNIVNMTPYSESKLANVVSLNDPNNNQREGGIEGQNVITNITLHIVDGDWGQNKFVNWSNNGNNNVSAHYGIATDGSIIQMVSEKNAAWANGGGKPGFIPNPFGNGNVGYNNNSVTIEISNLKSYNSGEGSFVASDGKEYYYKDGMVLMNGQYYTYPITNEALNSTIILVADIAKRNDIGELYHDGYNGTLTWHTDFPGVNKACPGDYVIAMTDYICESANMINEKGYYIPDYAIESQDGGGLMAAVLSASNPFEEGTVACDMFLTINSINGIRNSIGNIDVQKPAYNSTSTIPGNLINAESSLLGISSELNETIYNETKVISSIAQVFFDMDAERTRAAQALSNGNVSSFDESNYTSMLNDILSKDITSDISFDSYMFNPFSHIEGNSGKILLSDLTSMLSGNSLFGHLHDNLENEKQNARNTQRELNNLVNLINTGTNFNGNIWKNVSGRLNEYSDLMTLRIESADKLEQAIIKAIKLIIDYMGEDEELDDSKLPELRKTVKQIEQNIIDAQKIINSTHKATRYKEDEDGNVIYYTVNEYIYSVSARREAKNYVSQANELLIEINEKIYKLENLPIILAQAEQIINEVLVEIYGNYGVKASEAITGKEVSYIPPKNTNYVAPVLKKPELYFYPVENINGKVSEEEYNRNSQLCRQYATYEDYVNEVLRENNPMYNLNIKDNGINLDHSLYDNIFDELNNDILVSTSSKDNGYIGEKPTNSNNNSNHSQNNNQETIEDNQEVIENNQEVIEDNQEVIEDNQEVIEDNQETIEDNQEVIEDNQETIEDNQEVIEDNQEVIEDNQEIIEDNQEVIEDNHEVIEDNQEVIGNNQEVIENNQEVIENNQGVIEDNQGVIEDNQEVIEDNQEKLDDSLQEYPNDYEIPNESIDDILPPIIDDAPTDDAINPNLEDKQLSSDKKEMNFSKTIGVGLGITGVAGLAAIGAYKVKNNNTNEDEE